MPSLTSIIPPWVLFTDKGEPIAILPAMRSGEVASVKGMSLKRAQRIVAQANSAGANEVTIFLCDRIAHLEQRNAEYQRMLDDRAATDALLQKAIDLHAKIDAEGTTNADR